MKFAHRSLIASTTITFISKQTLLSILLILFKTINRIGTGPKAQMVAATPVSVTQPRVRVKSCRNRLRFAITESGWPIPEPRVRVKLFSQSEFNLRIFTANWIVIGPYAAYSNYLC